MCYLNKSVPCSNTSAVRKALESHLILRANILEPYGLKMREDLWLFLFFFPFDLIRLPHS